MIMILLILIIILYILELSSSDNNTIIYGYQLITKRPDSMPLPSNIECGEGKLRSSPMTGRIIDAILFNNEWDIIEARFYEYNEVVDYFIVYEDEVTFTGAPKRRTFPQLMEERLEAFKNKTIYVDGSKTRQRCVSNNAVAARNPDINGRSRDAAFDCEISARNSLIEYIPGGVQPDDFLLMSDSDQIIDEQYLRSLRWCTFPNNCMGFDILTHHYSLHFPSVRHIVGRSACKGSHMIAHPSMEDLHMCREKRGSITSARGSHGWHLSYFGSPLFIRHKLMSYAETQTNQPPYNQLSYITEHAYRGKELLERDVLELYYRDFKSISAPWFAFANMEHRQGFVRYSREDDKEKMTESKYITRCLILKSVSGGLGHQMFAIANIVARSNYLGIPYVLPLEKGTAATYWETSLLERILVDAFDRRDCAPVSIQTSFELEQYAAIPEVLPGIYEPLVVPENMTASSSRYFSVEIQGMLMDTKEILRSKSIIRNRIVSSIVRDEFHKLYPGRNLMISYHFHQKGLEWGTSWTYYEQAIRHVLQVNHTIHIFGASGIGKFAEMVLNMTSEHKQKIVIHEGRIDNHAQSARHLEHILHCDDFILYASPLAIWGAILTNVVDSVITYPMLGKENLIEKIKVDTWKGISVGDHN